jgi:hypothetical protein
VDWISPVWRSGGRERHLQSDAPTGVTFSQTPAVDVTGTPSIGARILVVGDPNLPKGERTFNKVFATAAFTPPVRGSVGDPSKTPLRGPGLNNWDIALLKTLAIQERLRVQVRSEFFKTFNHTQFNDMGTAAQYNAAGAQTNGQFGTNTVAQNPGILQMGPRVQF